MSTPLSVVWHSNSCWSPSGYGTQTRQVVSRMALDGHAVAVGANYGLEATVMDWTDPDNGAVIPHYPRGRDGWNNDVIGPYFDEWTAKHPGHRHGQFTLYDVWVYNSPRFDDIPTASWVPIDHMPAPPQVLDFLRKPTVLPIAMSQFGQRMLHERDVDCAYIPHAIDTTVFKPTGRVSAGDRMLTGREIMGIDRDRWVVGAVNANIGTSPSRKAWAENITAFAIFAKDHPDAVLYLHTDRDGSQGGLRLKDFCKSVGLQENQYRFANQWAYRMGIPQEALAAMYTDMDVLLAPTMGEGFGITAIEAQACGTRVIVNNFSAQPELVGDGWLTQGQPWWDHNQSAWFNVPLIGSIVECLEASYAAGRGRSAKAIDHVKANYDADTVYANQWRPLLEGLWA